MHDVLLNARELAQVLKVQPGTIRKWAREGRIPEVRISPKVRRFELKLVLQAIKRQEGGKHE